MKFFIRIALNDIQKYSRRGRGGSVDRMGKSSCITNCVNFDNRQRFRALRFDDSSGNTELPAAGSRRRVVMGVIPGIHDRGLFPSMPRLDQLRRSINYINPHTRRSSSAQIYAIIVYLKRRRQSWRNNRGNWGNYCTAARTLSGGKILLK